MRWKQQDANELGDQEWVPTGPNPFGVTIFYDDQEQEFVVVTEDGDHLGSAKTMAEAQEIAENFGYPLPDKPPRAKVAVAGRRCDRAKLARARCRTPCR